MLENETEAEYLYFEDTGTRGGTRHFVLLCSSFSSCYGSYGPNKVSYAELDNQSVLQQEEGEAAGRSA